MTKIGRNDACPCGSGQKYKKCCLPREEQARAVHPAHGRDEVFLQRLLDWTKHSHGPAWMQAAYDDFHEGFEDVEGTESWFWTILMYYYGGEENDQPTILQQFLATQPKLTPAEAEIAEAHGNARLSVFAIKQTLPGQAMLLEDMLCPGEFWVQERSASQAPLQTFLLGRIAHFGEDHLLFGMYPNPLPPTQGFQLVDLVKELARVRGDVLSPERLRQPDWAVELTVQWRVALEDMQHGPLPHLANSDGEEFCWVRDRFVYAAGQEQALEESLARLEGVDYDPKLRSGSFLEAGILHGAFEFVEGALIVQCNSESRADRLQERLTSLGIAGFRRARRTRKDGQKLMEQAAAQKKRAPAAMDLPPEAREYMRGLRRKFDTEWLDDNIPALQGKTPRQAVQTAQGKEQVERLLREFEFRGANGPEEQRSDIGWMRAELGL